MRTDLCLLPDSGVLERRLEASDNVGVRQIVISVGGHGNRVLTGGHCCGGEGAVGGGLEDKAAMELHEGVTRLVEPC